MVEKLRDKTRKSMPNLINMGKQFIPGCFLFPAERAGAARFPLPRFTLYKRAVIDKHVLINL